MFQNERTLSRYENTLGVRVVSVIDRICRGCQDNCNMSDFTLETPSLLSTPSRKDFKYLLMASNACWKNCESMLCSRLRIMHCSSVIPMPVRSLALLQLVKRHPFNRQHICSKHEMDCVKFSLDKTSSNCFSIQMINSIQIPCTALYRNNENGQRTGRKTPREVIAGHASHYR